MIQEVAGYDPGQRRTEIGRRIREARIQHHLTWTDPHWMSAILPEGGKVKAPYR